MTVPSVVVVSPHDLEQLVREAVRSELARFPPASSAPGVLVDKRECARALGISTASVDRHVRERRIPFLQVGDVRRFDLAAVRAALETTPAMPLTKPVSERVGRVRLLSRRTG